MANDNNIYLVAKFNFKVTWQEANIDIVCSEVSGLNITQEPIEYRDGKSPNFFPMKRPGLKKFDDVVLKKAIFEEDEDFYTWFETVYNREEGYRDDITIELYNENEEMIVQWVVHNAWVTKFETPDMNSLANEAAIESITLACEEITCGFAGNEAAAGGEEGGE